ncbi:MAG: hypothetical protein IH595_13730 [Bacteroidales bacterium]|nr:hypothetical protein [Bacteroidales bacterium]
MKNKLLLLLLFIPNVFYAQDVSIGTSVGFAGYGSPVDGYYFSFNVGVPIIKGIEVSPNFTFVSNLKNKPIEYYWNSIDGEQYIINTEKAHGNDMAGLIELDLIVKPFAYFRNKKISSIDFGMGAGYGFSVYSDNYYNYRDINATSQFVGTISKNGVRSSASVRLYYNYHFKKYYVGITAGMHDFIEGEGVSTIGLQFGITP